MSPCSRKTTAHRQLRMLGPGGYPSRVEKGTETSFRRSVEMAKEQILYLGNSRTAQYRSGSHHLTRVMPDPSSVTRELFIRGSCRYASSSGWSPSRTASRSLIPVSGASGGWADDCVQITSRPKKQIALAVIDVRWCVGVVVYASAVSW